MDAWLQNIFAWLPQGLPYYVLLSVIALLESVPAVGMLVPGSILTIFVGFLALHGKGDIVSVMIASSIGAFLGDIITYVGGGRLGPRINRSHFFQKRRALMLRADHFFVEHGGKSVLLGRFIGPLRGLIPFVAGYARMSPAVFGIYSLVSATAWGIAYPGLGYIGGASWKRVQVWAGRFTLLLVVLVCLFVLNALFWKKGAPIIAARSSAAWEKIRRTWGGWLQRPRVRAYAAANPRLWRWLADRFTLHKGSGLYLTIGFAVSSVFAILFLGLARDIGWLNRMDLSIYLRMAELRHPTLDAVLVTVSALGDGPVLLMLTVFALFWLILLNRDFSALILAAGMIGGELMVSLLHLFFQRPGPEPLVPQSPAIFTAFPSGHAFSTALLVGLCVYFILGTFGQWHSRLKLVMAASFLVLLVCLSRALLGLQWLSGILAGIALASVWLTFLITAGEVRRRYAGEFPWRPGWEPLHLHRWVRIALVVLAALGTATGITLYILRRIKGL